jgi:hypothetical protein
MATWVTAAEAEKLSAYSHQHIAYLVRNNKVEGRKSGNTWLIHLESLLAYEQKMQELGPQKHDPTRGNLVV